MRAILVCLSLGVAAAGCNSAPPPPPYQPVADVKTLMANIMEPAAEVYWDAVGIIVDDKGEQQIEPKTIEEWDAVRNAAYVVAESGNLLMMPTRAKDGGEWMDASQLMIEAARKAIRAAESRDKDAVFDVGAEMYDSCTNCHAKYSPDIVRPNAR
jgi:cytochrome c556